MKGLEIKDKTPLIEMLLAAGVLSFGEFTLKSGRVSPYFFNLGKIFQGDSLAALSKQYADLVMAEFADVNTVFGPAYKGIPLASTVSVYLSDRHSRSVGVTFDRKEAKTHGEGGELVGSTLAGNIVLIDDVITAGSAVRSSLEKIQRAVKEDDHALVKGLVVAMDRQEASVEGGPSAIQTLESETGLKVCALLHFADLIEYLQAKPEYQQNLDAMQAYRARYGSV